MEENALFSERQRFTQWWVWMMLIGINVLFIYGLYKQLIVGEPFGTNPASVTALILITIFIVLLTVFFLSTRLETQIRADGIYVRFFPIHLSYRYFGWNEIRKSYIRQYSSIKEFGGWGIRYGIGGRGKAYNVTGGTGLQLEFIDNKKLLIGTQKSEELELVLNNLGKLKQ